MLCNPGFCCNPETNFPIMIAIFLILHSKFSIISDTNSQMGIIPQTPTNNLSVPYNCFSLFFIVTMRDGREPFGT